MASAPLLHDLDRDAAFPWTGNTTSANQFKFRQTVYSLSMPRSIALVNALVFLLASAPKIAGTPSKNAPAPDGRVAIVVNGAVPADELSLEQLRRIFMGERQYWSPKLRITLLLRAPGTWERALVLKQLYQMSEAQLSRYWISKAFRDELTMPAQTVYSTEMALKLVARTPGAITFVDASQVPEGFKVVKIIKASGNPTSPS
jgi:ABC-type phosphate transport system substrate-binding protein